MHKLGCPQTHNPYAHCQCTALDQREHTEQLRAHNEEARQADSPLAAVVRALARLQQQCLRMQREAQQEGATIRREGDHATAAHFDTTAAALGLAVQAAIQELDHATRPQ